MHYRKSQQRERILELLKNTDTHPTAEWIYSQLKDEIPDLSLGTVYRNLKILMKQGHIQKYSFGSSQDHFEAKIEQHYHIVCESCGKVLDLDIPLFGEINQIAQMNSKFNVAGHRIEFFGMCEKCQNIPI